jgi:hypothetical protein
VKVLARLPFANYGLCARLDTLNCNPQVLNALQASGEETVLMRLPNVQIVNIAKRLFMGHIDGFEGSARME